MTTGTGTDKARMSRFERRLGLVLAEGGFITKEYLERSTLSRLRSRFRKRGNAWSACCKSADGLARTPLLPSSAFI